MVILSDIKLVKKNNNDRIVTINVNDLGIKKAKLGSCYEVTIRGLIKLQLVVNRKDGSTLSISQEHLPRYVKLPRVGKSSVLPVVSIRKLY